MMKRFWILLLVLCLPLCAMAEEITIGNQTVAVNERHVVLEKPRLAVSKLTAALAQLDGMETLSLMNCAYEPKDLIRIREALPGVEVRAVFTWNNRTYDTHAKEAAIKVSSLHVNELRWFLDAMDHLETVDMYQVRISLTNMKKILEEYPHIDFGWSLPINQKRIRTDATAYSTLNPGGSSGFTSAFFEEYLPYLPDLLALDLGHNSIDDLSFLRLYPKLKVLILADNDLTNEDLETLAECCPELEYLEIFMNPIDDLSPLTKLKNLKHLNIARNEISDGTPLLQMPQLKRCWLPLTQIPKEQQDMLREAMPDTVFEFDVRSCTAGGWRDDAPEYKAVFRMFNTYTYIPFEEEP